MSLAPFLSIHQSQLRSQQQIMVDLTPPSSKHSTPLRPIDSSSDLPASPTSTAKPPLHPLAMPTGNKMDVDEATSSGSDNHFEVPDEVVEDEEEEGESVEAEGGVEGDMGKVEESGGEVIEEPGGTERSSGRARKSKVGLAYHTGETS